ncbi:hypothetical protein KI387_008607 [Taxus chinensis]|uniref:Uncharacterized protein n=1 Tax=Taxus chinensis TaxID=29808 RepID=A0AA38CVS8_TAXCH|nr:hypothetical protein KI387_008607 [Taxus chinensis]
MDLECPTPSTPKFAVGTETADFLTSSGVLHRSWEEIHRVSINNVYTFHVTVLEDVVYVIFPSFYVEDFMVKEGRYGECNIQKENTVFSACLKGDDGEPAVVHKGALNIFLHILRSSDFKAQMDSVLKQKKEQTIIFAGHFVGGAVATLATIWFLGKRARNISPLCITFGSPLLGDARLGEAIGREGWSGNFCHVVSKYDIVPRMFLAPFESIAEPLNAIVPHWRNIMGIDSVAVSHTSIKEACRTLLNNVLTFTSTIANDYPGDSGLRSPYRPFGTYMFCSGRGAACIENSEAVLKMLHFTMQREEGMSFDQIAGACISEHTGYGHMLEDVTDYILNATKAANFVSDDSFEMGITLELEAIGVGAQNEHARIALRKARKVKNEQDMNYEELNDRLSKHQSHMAGLEWYKRSPKAKGTGYYDSFKQHSDKKDFKVNLARTALETFWDGIVDMVEKHELPSDFRFQNKWINAGTAYRRLVEPLDIADHYHLRKSNKSYLSEGVRPHRHIVLERWLKEKDQTRIGRDKKERTKFASLTLDSCFWAHLEEACKALNFLQTGEGQHQEGNAHLKECLEFEDYVGRMIKDKSMSDEIFLEQSSFMIWWQQYSHLQLQSPRWKSSSPLFDFMESETWKKKF